MARSSRLGAWLAGGSGPAVARLFHRLLALIFLDAWLSLGVQAAALVGSRGLLPIAPFLDGARAGTSFAQLPTWLWLSASDGIIAAGICLGAAASLAALAGLWPRRMLALATFLYLGYVIAGRTFFSFQWDNLLIECGVLAACLPSSRPSTIAHLALRLLLFKLYFESGIAKWHSPLRDWHDGSAMSFYYETAPLPTALAWYAHQLPASWHRLESWATLAFELAVPFLIFGPRRARTFAAAVFTLFQIANAATANYGFFCYLALALHVFLLDDRDVERFTTLLRALLRRPAPATTPSQSTSPAAQSAPRYSKIKRAFAVAAIVVYATFSLIEAWAAFGPPGAWLDALVPLRARYLPYRVFNTYHLFAQITRERIEPQFEVESGGIWIPLEMRHKAGDPRRRPGWVAPHQPRLDFQLWFYGLSYRRSAPAYVANLIDRLCHDRDIAQRLFATPIPEHPDAVRIVFRQYHFTNHNERNSTGAWWRTRDIETTPRIDCGARQSR